METSTDAPESNSVYSHAIRWGVILGAIAIALTVLLYLLSPAKMVELKFQFLILVVSLVVAIYSGIQYRNEIGGFLPYSQAFLHGFVVFVVSGFMNAVFGYILFEFIDPSLVQVVTDAVLNNTESMMRSFGADDDAIEKAMEGVRKSMPEGFSLLGRMKSFGWGILVSAVIALLTAIFVKRNQQVV